MPTAVHFYDPDARRLVSEAIRLIEQRTRADVIVALRRHSTSYRLADQRAGAIAAMVALLVLLFHPIHFAVFAIPFDVAFAYGLGYFVASRSSTVRRWLTPGAVRDAAVRAAARETFVDLGVSRTRRRMGVLVYVSMLERRAEVVADVGIDPTALGPGWSTAVGSLDAALRARPTREPNFAEFLRALDALGASLAQALPRRAGDDSELSDEVSSS